jgi:hypothetical protein
MKLQYTFTRQFFLRGLRPRTPQRGYPPSALPCVEEYTYFWGVNTSWGINATESKRPLNQEDNQAPQPTTRGLEPPSSCSWKTKEIGACNECNFSRHIRKNIMWFTIDLGFHVKHWCTVYVYVCSFIHCSAVIG